MLSSRKNLFGIFSLALMFHKET